MYSIPSRVYNLQTGPLTGKYIFNPCLLPVSLCSATGVCVTSFIAIHTQTPIFIQIPACSPFRARSSFTGEAEMSSSERTTVSPCANLPGLVFESFYWTGALYSIARVSTSCVRER